MNRWSQLLRRTPTRITAINGAIAVFVLGLLLVACQGAPPSEPSVAPQTSIGLTATATARPIPVGPLRFFPATHREGDKVVMPVTFPDGTTAELVYVPELDLAALGVRPYSSGGLHGCCGRDFNIVYGESTLLYAEDSPVTRYERAEGEPVELWRAADVSPTFWLVFHFGSWTVRVWDGPVDTMSEQQRAVWAASLLGRETPKGFLILGAKPPLRLAGAGDHSGPELQFGDLGSRFILFFPGPCTPYEGEDVVYVKGLAVHRSGLGSSGLFAGWCNPEAFMRVHVYADDNAFIDALLAGLEIRNVELAAAPG